jgi:hypothetical protein
MGLNVIVLVELAENNVRPNACVCQCTADACVGHGIAVRKRVVQCISDAGRGLRDDECSAEEKLPDREYCSHPDCQVLWRPSGWTKVSNMVDPGAEQYKDDQLPTSKTRFVGRA